MARREFARIGTDMPDEDSIKALDVEPQWLYDRLLLRNEMSRCGVVPLRPALWADLAANATETKIARWLRALTEGGHVVVDERYQEAFVRTFVRHDGLLGQPNVVANMCNDFTLIASQAVRFAFLAEFRRIWHLPLSAAWRGGWLLAVGVYPEVARSKEEKWPDALPTSSIDRLRKAIRGNGLRDALVAAIASGDVEPFTEPFPEGLAEGLPEALNEPAAKPHAEPGAEPPRAGAIAVSAFSELRAPLRTSEVEPTHHRSGAA